MSSHIRKVEALLHQREQQLASLELQRSAILDSLPANVCVIDTTGTIVFVNQTWQRFARENGLTGMHGGYGANYLAVCDAADDDPAAHEIATAIRSTLDGRRDGFETDYPCHSPAAKRWFRCLVRPIGGGAVIMHLDITAQKTAALEMARAQALVAAMNEQKSILLANMSHELRTPLNAIIGFSELMVTEAFGPLAPRYAEYAHDIHFSGVHLLNVVNDLLDLRRIETGDLPLDIRPIGLSSVVREVLVLFRKDAADKNLRISCRIADDLVVLADDLRLRQIIINLLSNALKFTPSKGSIGLEAGRDEAGGIWLAVSDSGIGMSAAEIAIALRPFGQIVNNATRQKQGTGLGLPLAKQLIELHGGRLEIASAPGVGSRFALTLPAGPDA